MREHLTEIFDEQTYEDFINSGQRLGEYFADYINSDEYDYPLVEHHAEQFDWAFNYGEDEITAEDLEYYRKWDLAS